MQERLLDILILGLLVLLFGAIYRRRATLRLRLWISGWLFVLGHFAALVPHAPSPFWEQVQEICSLSGLLLGGVCFVLAAVSFSLSKRNLAFLAAGIGIPPLIYIFLAISSPAAVWAQIIVAVSVEAIVAGLGWHFRRGFSSSFWLKAGAAVACGSWLIWMIAHGQGDLGVYAILTQIFFFNAVLFWRDFHRVSAGVITASAGLLAWAAVFPTAIFLAHFSPAVHAPDELWNVPKYFVEFGMILTLMENQLYSAKWQSEQYRLLFDSNPHPMFIYNAKSLAFLLVNDAALAQYGYSRAEFLDMTVAKLHDLATVTGIERLLTNTVSPVRVSGPWTQRRKDGSEFQAEMSSHAIDFEGRDARLCMAQDVTDRQRLHEQLLHRAHHDSLTDLPNRFLLEQRMRHTLENASRYSHKVAVLCIDLDRFKQINDKYGHPTGDVCLQAVAERLTSRLRESDTVARTGGEEFTVVIGELLHAVDAEKVASDLLAMIRRPFILGELEIQMGASIGIAIYPDHGTEGWHLWRASDFAMYRAKYSGGNQYTVVSDEDAEYSFASPMMRQTSRTEDRRT